MNKKDKDIALFVAFCIEEYGVAKEMAAPQVLDLFSQYGVTDYLAQWFEPLHTQGRQWLMAEIDEFIENRHEEGDTKFTPGVINKRPQPFVGPHPVTQDNLHILLPGKISWLVEYLHDDYGFSLQESLHRIYHSEVYKKLSTESTKYWHLGPVDLYAELKEEWQATGCSTDK